MYLNHVKKRILNRRETTRQGHGWDNPFYPSDPRLSSSLCLSVFARVQIRVIRAIRG